MSDSDKKSVQLSEKKLSESFFYQYHCKTKHTLEKLYGSRHSLDWSNQPDPFRRYAGAPVVMLSRDIRLRSNSSFFEASSLLRQSQQSLQSRLLHREPAACSKLQTQRFPPIESSFVSKLLYYSLALSAWKQVKGTNHRWALRVNPSSGNLHPVDTHILVTGSRCTKEIRHASPAVAEPAATQETGTECPSERRSTPESGTADDASVPECTTGGARSAAIDETLISAGVYHYLVCEHVLEQRYNNNSSSYNEHTLGDRLWTILKRTDVIPPLVLCITNIFWREAWKYQSRAFRYCQHDTGHALCSLMLAAAALGWQCEVVCEFPDDEITELFGLTSTDEHPMALILLSPLPQRNAENESPEFADEQTEQSLRVSNNNNNANLPNESPRVFFGTANELSPTQVAYPIIDEVYRATCLSLQEYSHRLDSQCRRNDLHNVPLIPERFQQNTDQPHILLSDYQGEFRSESFDQVVRSRRSAVDMDGRQRISLSRLAKMLSESTAGFLSEFCLKGSDHNATMAGTLPLQDSPEYLIHLYVYAHRVDGLEPGLYYLHRDTNRLILVKEGAQQQVARFVSCMQDIAADGCFAISMIANFNRAFFRFGERAYRYVHYEAGYIGQMLYLSATALNLQATGIGCFMDDEVNHYAELPPGFEVVYNFTIGRAVEDPRLTSLPAYPFSQD